MVSEVRIGSCLFRPERAELLDPAGQPVPLRPQALRLLEALLRRPGQLVSRDALLAEVWPGLVVGDDSLVQCVSDLRRALGDARHELLLTVPRRGYRLVAAAPSGLPAAAGPAATAPAPAPHPASIAVLPFASLAGEAAPHGGLGAHLAHDVITRLAKLRCLFVIAPATMSVLAERGHGAEEAGRMLAVAYVVDGTLHSDAARLRLTARLIETRSARILWAEDFELPQHEALGLLDQVGERIVATLASQIEQAERHRALLKPPEGLDAWEAHHRGLWHMYRFEREHNAQAHHFFQTAVRLDPGFSRPWAGLSFTHWQNAFQGWGERERETDLAYRCAAEGLMADEFDPAAHWAMGRALWLRGQIADSLEALDVSVTLSPNFALGHYARAFVHCQSGDPRTTLEAADRSRALSPHDPLLFAMLSCRATALMRLGRHDEAADWALRAVAQPNAHAHIFSLTAYCLALAGRHDEALAAVAALHQRWPGYRFENIRAAYSYDAALLARIKRACAGIGLD